MSGPGGPDPWAPPGHTHHGPPLPPRPLPPPPTGPPPRPPVRPPIQPQPSWQPQPQPQPPTQWTGAPPANQGVLPLLIVVLVVVVAAVTWGVVWRLGASEGDGAASGPEGTELPRTEPNIEPSEPAGAGETGRGEGASASPEAGDADPECTGESNGTLAIGGLLPETGDLSFLAPPMKAAAQLAVDDINAAGGVLGQDVTYTPGDSGDSDPDLASPTIDAHIQSGADVILGAAASGVSLTVRDKVTDACLVQFSPSATAPELSDPDDGDLFFRTAPSDTLQGQALADLMVGDGATSAAILARADSYGTVLMEATSSAYEAQGGEVVAAEAYDPEAGAASQDIVDAITTVMDADPDALVLIGFDETADILTAFYAQGFTSTDKGIYLSDGNIGDFFGDAFTGTGSLAGVKGTVPQAEVPTAFSARLSDVDASLEFFDYGPETYDAVVITALAAEAAGTDEPAQVARQINGVTRDGEPCDEFAACLEMTLNGDDIDYDGPSGPQDFSRSGEPTVASFAVLEFGPDNHIDDDLTTYHLAEFL